jgi:hypothetical protein
MIDSWLEIGSDNSNNIPRKRSGLSKIESGIFKDHHIQVWLKINIHFKAEDICLKKCRTQNAIYDFPNRFMLITTLLW